MANPVGMKRVFQTKLTDVASSDKEGVGTVRREGDNEYIFLKGVASTGQYDAVGIQADYSTVLLNKTEADKLRRVAIAQAALVASKYGWYLLRGEGYVNLLANCAKDVALYTTATAGSLDDTSASQTKVLGIVNQTAITSAAAAMCYVNYPHTM